MKYFTRISVLFLLMACSLALSAQPDKKVKKKTAVRYPVFVGYFGDGYGLNPGFKVGVENPLKRWVKVITNSNLPDPTRDLYHTLYLGYYNHSGSHYALLFGAEGGFRFTNQSGFYHEYQVGLGGMNTRPLDNITNNTLEESQESSFYATAHGSIALGYDFLNLNPTLPLGIFIRATAMIQVPYADGFREHYVAEAGIRWRLKKVKGVKTIY